MHTFAVAGLDTSHESAKDIRASVRMPACQMYREAPLGSFCDKNGLFVSHEDALSCPTVYAGLAYRGTPTSTDHTRDSDHDNATFY